jgi:hypothetical protein
VVRPGGLLFFDDYDYFPGVANALNQFAKNNDLIIQKVHRSSGNVYIVKPTFKGVVFNLTFAPPA